MENLTNESFKEKVFDYENISNNEIGLKSDKPVVVDFYADWCNPCKMVSPILEELSEEYENKIEFYKVNTEEQQELSSVFGIKSIPTIIFIPLDSQPQVLMGALPKDKFKEVISELFNIK